MPIWRLLLRHWVCFAFALARASAGRSNPARIAMMAITTSNSMRVNAPRRLIRTAKAAFMDRSWSCADAYWNSAQTASHFVAATRFSTQKLLRDHGCIVPAEAEGVVDHRVDRHFTRRVGHVIQIAQWIGMLVVDGGRDDVGLDRLGANGHLHRARGAEHVAGGPLGGTHGQLFGMVTEDLLDRLCFADIA